MLLAFEVAFEVVEVSELCLESLPPTLGLAELAKLVNFPAKSFEGFLDLIRLNMTHSKQVGIGVWWPSLCKTAFLLVFGLFHFPLACFQRDNHNFYIYLGTLMGIVLGHESKFCILTAYFPVLFKVSWERVYCSWHHL